MATSVLYTIPFSHYCEKARWALELAGVAFEERGYLPGLNRLATARFGGTTVPLFVTDGLVLKDSTDIVSYADRRAVSDAQRLLPSEPAALERALAIEDRFDKRMGVAARAWAYTYVLEDKALLFELASKNIPSIQAALLAAARGGLATVIRKGLRIGPTTRAWAQQRVDEDFAYAGELLSDGRPFLAGDRFTVADLAFATLSAPALLPAEYGAPLPSLDRLPSDGAAQVRAWRDTVGGRHALRIYREHRHPAASA